MSAEPLLIIGIAGVARSGKDTIARHLVEHHGFTRVALADSLRALLAEMDGSTWELRKEYEAAGKTSRWALQTLGTECREALPEATDSLWCLVALSKIRFLAEHMPTARRRFVVPDIRFPHEPTVLGSAARDWHGSYETWKVVRDAAGLGGDAAKHASERLIDSIPCSVEIENNESLDDLRYNVDCQAMFAGRQQPIDIETVLRDWCNSHPDEAREGYVEMVAREALGIA